MQIRPFLCLVLFSLAPYAGMSQKSDPEAAKLKAARSTKLIEKIEIDAERLKLPENRAVITARIGAIAWKTDPERGKKLFQSAIADLSAAQQEAEGSRGRAHIYYDLLNSQNVRPQILNIIAAVDAEYALESLYRTRPSIVTRALAGDRAERKLDNGQSLHGIAQNEMNLEQRIARLVADQKPEKAIAILRENIKKRLSNETYETLKKLYLKDPGAAAEVADEVVSKLNSSEFYSENQANYDLLQISTSIVTDHIRERSPDEKYLAFGDAGVRQLSIKLVNTYIEHGSRIGWVPIDQLEPLAKRYAPNSVEKLRKASESGRGFGHRSMPSNAEYNKFMGTDPNADQMVQAAGTYTPELQRQLYQNAANKFSEAGQYQNAVSLLNDKFEGDALENAVSSLNWYYAHHLMQKGEFDAAEALMFEFNESNRVSGLTSLANFIFNQNPAENRSRAATLLRRVRGLLPDKPENSNETNQMFALIGAMTTIESSDAFANLEPMLEHLNKLVEAFAVVQAYHGNQVRQGEYNIAMGNGFGVYFDLNTFRNLANADFDRTNAIIDLFDRPELRLSIRMYLAEGF